MHFRTSFLPLLLLPALSLAAPHDGEEHDESIVNVPAIPTPTATDLECKEACLTLSEGELTVCSPEWIRVYNVCAQEPCLKYPRPEVAYECDRPGVPSDDEGTTGTMSILPINIPTETDAGITGSMTVPEGTSTTAPVEDAETTGSMTIPEGTSTTAPPANTTDDSGAPVESEDPDSGAMALQWQASWAAIAGGLLFSAFLL